MNYLSAKEISRRYCLSRSTAERIISDIKRDSPDEVIYYGRFVRVSERSVTSKFTKKK